MEFAQIDAIELRVIQLKVVDKFFFCILQIQEVQANLFEKELQIVAEEEKLKEQTINNNNVNDVDDSDPNSANGKTSDKVYVERDNYRKILNKDFSMYFSTYSLKKINFNCDYYFLVECLEAAVHRAAQLKRTKYIKRAIDLNVKKICIYI